MDFVKATLTLFFIFVYHHHPQARPIFFLSCMRSNSASRFVLDTPYNEEGVDGRVVPTLATIGN